MTNIIGSEHRLAANTFAENRLAAIIQSQQASVWRRTPV